MLKNSCIILCFVLVLNVQSQNVSRDVKLLDTGWKFINREISDASLIAINDSDWETVTVPHDWAISKNFDMNIDQQSVKVTEDGDTVEKLRTGRTGALPCFGIGWYRKVLPVNKDDEGKRFFIEIDGAMSLAKVYLNNDFIGEWPYGYSSFSFELTKSIRFDKKNVISIRLENKQESFRWYPGAGLYRNVRLLKTNKTRIAHWGTQISTSKLTEKSVQINIKTSLDRQENIIGNLKLITEVFDPQGQKVNTHSENVRQNDSIIQQVLSVKNPNLWSPESPNRYVAVSKLFSNSKLIDEYKTVFGIRSLLFDKDKGFFLNGKYTKIKGVCLHHDLGPLGAAVNYRATERQLVMLKEMGCNAIRTAHNPPSPELLQICDSIGLMVQVEAFDEWRTGKNINGYHNFFDKWAERDLRAMVRRDRNHPSVIMWSIGNEVREQSMSEGKELAHWLTSICHQEDATRLVTSGFNNHNSAIKNGMAAEVDLVGFNYKPNDYVSKHAQYPNFIIYGSETASTVSSRGEYKFPAKQVKGPWYNDYQVSSYDLEFASWATLPDTEFAAQDDNDFIAGEFVWTGFDYLGEPTPYNEGTPAKSSYFGIIDLAGLKKDRFYLYQSNWSSEPVLHLLPHWNWSERLGQKVPVFCYTNYPKVELFVNGISQGIKEKNKTNTLSRYRLMWNDVIYQPGEIKAVAYDNQNKVVATEIIKTAGEPYSVRLTPDRTTLKANGKDVSFITIEVVDKNGNLCPKADNMLFFNLSGEGILKAVCNGNPIDQTSFSSTYMKTFNGKLVATVQSSQKIGELTVTVSGGKLVQKSIEIKTED